MSTRDRIVNEMARVLRMDASAIEDSHSLVADLAADSLDSVEIVMAIEDEFRIEIPVAVAEEIRTVADAIALVERLTKEQSNG